MRKRRVIVFDDEKIIVNMFTDFFSMMGYEVLTYTTPVSCPIYGESASECLKLYPCADVIITDFKMCGMNGLDLLASQSQHGCKLTNENKALMSAFIDQETRKKVERMGCAFFEKPVHLNELSAWIRECEKRVDPSLPLGSRRIEIRHVTSHAIRCLVDRTDRVLIGMTVDISDSGLRIRIADPLLPKQKIHLDTELPVIACHTASVRWVRQNQDGSYLAGLACH